MTIGIFDSGLGAHLVANRLQEHFPDHSFRIATDEQHVPYGDRSAAEITSLVEKALQPLLEECRVIVIACNTATAVAIDQLRTTYPDHEFIGYEPMIKPAAELSTSGIVTVLATTATRQSSRYQRLVQTYASEITILEPDTDEWASLIQHDRANDIDLAETIASVKEHGSDVITLACTHYLALESELRAQLPDAHVIEPTPAIANQLKQILATRQL